MLYDPRTIAFAVEVLHPPVKHQPKTLQELHSKLFVDARASYQNFALLPGGAQLSNSMSKAQMQSVVNFLPDRMQIREEFSGISLDDYCAKLERLAAIVLEETEIKMISAQQCVVRSLINPKQFRDSRQYFAQGLLRFSGEDLNTFGRPAQLMGLRFIFPKTTDRHEIFSMRLESYNADPQSIYLENVGTFAPLQNAQDSQQLIQNLHATYQFLVNEGLAFLARFDRQREAQ